jgi:hypothetical protein
MTYEERIVSSDLSDLQNSARTVRSLLVIRGRGIEGLGEGVGMVMMLRLDQSGEREPGLICGAEVT